MSRLRFGRGPGEAELADPAAYPESWLYPLEGRWLERFRRDVDQARKAGMREGVFTRIGDSNMLAFNSFYGLGCREPAWGDQADREELEGVIGRYRALELPPGADIPFIHCPSLDERRPWNSFTRVPAAAMMGIVARHLVRPAEGQGELPHFWREDPDRLDGESPLETELRLTRPLYTLIQVGSNGLNYGDSPEQTAASVADLVARVRRFGSVPVVFTIPPQIDHEAAPGRAGYAKDAAMLIARMAARRRVPLVNFWLALSTENMVAHGLVEEDGVIFDGVHLETFGGAHQPGGLERSIDFHPEALRYGANFRNLLLLRLLRDLDSLAGISQA